MSYKAFVSSTFEDLKDHRAHVILALERAGFFVDPMEKWPADSDEPKRFSQDRLNGCHLYVLLVAFRRGYVPDGETRSITQLEYDAAVKQGIDILVLLLDDNARWLRKFDERMFDGDKLNKDMEITKWRDYLCKHHGRELFNDDPRSLDMAGAFGRWFAKKKADPTEQGRIKRIDWPEGTSPYPGLLSFNKEYAELFFGRDWEVDAVLAKMSEPGGRVLIISGASGSGKSSLVAAGVWRGLKEERLPGSAKWIWLRIQPGKGNRLFESLAWGLTHAFPRISTRPDDLASELTGNKKTIADLLAAHLTHGQEFVLFIDQLEELFSQGFKDEDIKNFLEHLIATARDTRSQLHVVATVRSEFIARLEESEPVLQIFNAGFNFHLGPVSPRMLQDMIEKPVQATGYKFEKGLVDEILQDAGQEQGSLPLVAYALAQLFECRNGRTFERAVYKAIGKVAGAMGTKADQELDRLNEQARGAFDRVFAELVHLERERPPTRKRAMLSVFGTDKAANQLIDALAGQDCRILVKAGEGSEATVEVAHEKLFTAWPKVKGWMDGNGDLLRLIDYAEEAARRWHETGGHLQELWRKERADAIRNALIRFNKKGSLLLDDMLSPQQMLIKRLKENVTHEDRLLTGKKLAEFGDPRLGVGLRKNGLPHIKWIPIPPGRVELWDIKQAFEVKAFQISKYLVTNAQFEAFIEAGDGYHNEEWWQGIQRSDAPSTPSWKEPNCPRETVSWFEAVVFCCWLSHRTGSKIRLPTEWEWQQAARGGGLSRKYPWSDGWDPSRCNGSESRLQRTIAVGMYLSGATRHGVLDMAGNVWEWCLNRYANPEQAQAILPSDDPGGDSRVILGGGWYDRPEALRVSIRDRNHAVNRYDDIGFRLAQDID